MIEIVKQDGGFTYKIPVQFLPTGGFIGVRYGWTETKDHALACIITEAGIPAGEMFSVAFFNGREWEAKKEIA